MARKRNDLDDIKRVAVERYFERKPPSGRGPMFGARALGGGRGRRRRGDVRASLLLLLAEEPRNGYQLMQAIGELSEGRWRPSPGSIYPSLAQLEDEGLIVARETDGNRAFELTDAGRKHLEERHGDAPPWVDPDEPVALSDLRDQIGQLHVAAMQVAHAGREAHVASAARALAEARRTLYRILAEDDDE